MIEFGLQSAMPKQSLILGMPMWRRRYVIVICDVLEALVDEREEFIVLTDF